MVDRYYEKLKPRQKVLHVLKLLGGEQSTEALNEHLKMKRKNLDSLLSRLSQDGQIERVKVGVYRSMLNSEN